MPEVAPAVEAPAVAPVTPEVPETPVTAPPAVAPEKTFTQKELDDILEKRLAKERRKRDDDKREKEYWRQEALKRPSQPEKHAEVVKSDDGAPKREAYGSYEDYVEARAEWKAEQAVEKRLAKKSEEEEKTRTASEQQKQAEEFKSRAKKVSAELEDFEEVMKSSESPMTQAMAKAIYAAGDDGPRVAYHLAKDREEAERIASLPDVLQAREIVLLEMKLKATPAKSPSKAPAPISPVGGKATSSSDTPSDEDSTAAWIEKENKRTRKLKA